MEHVLGGDTRSTYIAIMLTIVIVPAQDDSSNLKARASAVRTADRWYAFSRAASQAVINIGVTYYTGMVDTVARIPERCYIADGFEPTSYKVVTWSSL